MKNVPLICFVNRLIQFEIRLDSAAWYYNVGDAFRKKSRHSSPAPAQRSYFTIKQRGLRNKQGCSLPRQPAQTPELQAESTATTSIHRSAASQPHNRPQLSGRAMLRVSKHFQSLKPERGWVENRLLRKKTKTNHKPINIHLLSLHPTLDFAQSWGERTPLWKYRKGFDSGLAFTLIVTGLPQNWISLVLFLQI